MTGRIADLPTVDSASLPATEDGPVVAGILLAAGTSDRFGERNKLLAETEVDEGGVDEGEPIVRRAARTLVDAGLEPTVAVLGNDAERTRAALAKLPIRTVVNDDPGRGQASSVRTGIDAIRSITRVDKTDEHGIDAVVIALGDMPWVAPETIDALVAAHAIGVGDALAPAYDGVRGNPVLFDRRHFDTLAALEGDVGGRRILLEGDESALVAVNDPGVLPDVDTPDDLSWDRSPRR